MARRILPLVVFLLLVGGGLWLALGPGSKPGDVTIYTAIDDEIARDFLKRFEEETGIVVNLVTDTEATKSVGLATALLEEGKPGRTVKADVYWNNEPLWTVRLAAAGVLETYDSPAAAGIPAAYRDPKGFWTANGLRARIFITHPGTLGETKPASFRDLAAPAFRESGALAIPRAGTTLSHMSALRAVLGAAAFDAWFRATAENGTSFPSGNGSLAREVGRGARAFGFTDTDDFNVRKKAGDPVELVFPDQEEGGVGTFVLPLPVSLVRGGPHPANARRLYDWLVSPEAEAALSATSYAAIPVRPKTKPGPDAVSLAGFRAAVVDWNEAAPHIDAVLDRVTEVLGK